MKHFFTIFILLLTINYGKADQLEVLTEEQAIKAVNYIEAHPNLVLWCACCDGDKPLYVKVNKPEYQSGRIVTEMYEVIIHGINAEGDSVITGIDLAYAHVIIDGSAYCIGTELEFECDPCTEPFTFDIPEIKPVQKQGKLIKMDFSTTKQNIPEIKYKWIILNKEPFTSFDAIESWTSSLAFTKDEKYIIAAGGYFDDKSGLKKYHIETGKETFEYIGHEQQVEAIAISNNGKYMISSDQTGRVIIWDLETDKILYKYDDAHTDWVEGVCFSHNNKYAASASRDNFIKIWELKSGKLVRKLKSNFEIASSVAFEMNNKNLIVGGIGVEDEVCIYDLKNGNIISSMNLHTRWSKSIDVSPDGYNFASAGDDDKSVELVALEFEDIYQTAKSPFGNVINIDYDPTGQYLAVASMWGIFVWDIKDRSIVFEAKPDKFPIECVKFSNSGKYLASCGRDAKINIWKVK